MGIGSVSLVDAM